jgi:acetoin utilization deacetylase AcuC-like enzyme
VTGTVLVTSHRFLDPGLPRGEPSSDPFGTERIRVVQRAVEAAAPGLRRLEPRTATQDELLMVHTPEYVTLVREYSEGTRPRDDYRWLSAEVAIRSNNPETIGGLVARHVVSVAGG